MEVLKALDRLVIRERSDSSSSRYVVLTSEGVPVMQARENTGLLHQVLAGRSRAFHIDIYDMEQHEVSWRLSGIIENVQYKVSERFHV